MQPVSKIVMDLTKSVGASGVQLLITLLSTPIMTRLYDPTAYATFGIVNMLATTIVGIGLFSLPNAYPLEKDDAQHTSLLQTMLALLTIWILVTAVTATIAAATGAVHISLPVLILLPVLVLTFGIRQITMAIATAHANFHRIAVGQVVEPACSRFGSIALGAALGSHAVWILGSVAVGNLVAAYTIGKTTFRNTMGQWRSLVPHRLPLMPTLKRYGDFVVYNTASLQAQSLVMLGIQMGIAAFFSTHDAGQYILAASILTLPATMVALATSRVVYRHFIEVEHTHPQRLSQELLRATLLYLAAGIIILSPVFFFGETIFTIAFSDVWTQAGSIARILSLAYVGTFVFNGVQSIFRVTRRLRLQFILEMISCGIILAVVLFVFPQLDFWASIHTLAALWLLRNLLMLIACILIAYQHANRLEVTHG